MTRYNVPSNSRPGVEYEISVTDDGGLICECQGYSQKVAVSYVTGVRHGMNSLCRHAKQIANTFSLAQRQPQFMWTSLANGDTFPITSRPRGKEEHMLAYRYDGMLEPLESAKDDIFPKETAKPDRDETGRVIDLLTAPPHEIVIVTTGICPSDVTTPKQVRKIVADTGARIKPGDVTANTTVLAVGSNPNRKKLDRAAELLTPTVDFPGLIAILEGRRRHATDQHGSLLMGPTPQVNLDDVFCNYTELITKLADQSSCNWIQTLETQHKLHQSLNDAAQSIDRVIAQIEENEDALHPATLARDTLNGISTNMRKMAAQTLTLNLSKHQTTAESPS